MRDRNRQRIWVKAKPGLPEADGVNVAEIVLSAATSEHHFPKKTGGHVSSHNHDMAWMSAIKPSKQVNRNPGNRTPTLGPEPWTGSDVSLESTCSDSMGHPATSYREHLRARGSQTLQRTLGSLRVRPSPPISSKNADDVSVNASLQQPSVAALSQIVGWRQTTDQNCWAPSASEPSVMGGHQGPIADCYQHMANCQSTQLLYGLDTVMPENCSQTLLVCGATSHVGLMPLCQQMMGTSEMCEGFFFEECTPPRIESDLLAIAMPDAHALSSIQIAEQLRAGAQCMYED